MKRKKSMAGTFTWIMFIMTLVPVAIFGIASISVEYLMGERECHALRERYIDYQESIVKKEVQEAVKYIEWRRANSRIPQEDLKKEILRWLSMKRYRSLGKEDGIFFVRNFDGIQLMSVSKPEIVGKDTSKLTDPHGINTHRLFMEVIKNPDGGFADYSWYDPYEKRITPKRTFVMAVPEWRWYIGSGFWFNDINSVINKEKSRIAHTLSIQALAAMGIILLLVPFIYALSRYMAKSIDKSMASFTGFFDRAATELTRIDEKAMDFREFERLATSANRMIKELKVARQGMEDLQRIVDLSPMVAFLCRAEQGWPVELVSRNISSFGYSPEDFYTGKLNYASIIHPDDLDRVNDEVSRFSSEKGRKSFSHEYRILTSSGETRWVDDRTRIRRDATGKVTHYQGIILDVTESRTAQQRLVESEERYRTVVENTHDGLLIADNEYHITFANKQLLKILGRTEEEVIGHDFRDFLDEESVGIVADHYMRRQMGEKVEPRYEFNVERKDGERRRVEISSSIVRDTQGHITTVAQLIDITDKKRLEEQLLLAQKMEAVGTLAGGIAHDFNNLLMGILGNTSLMLMDMDPDDPRYQRLKNIEQAVHSGAELTKQLLGYARGGKYEVKSADPNDLVKGALNMFGRTKKEISIHTMLQEDVWNIEVDKSQIEQVLLNICVNAWQAMPEGGDLYIQTQNTVLDENYTRAYNTQAGRYVKISFTDTGHGMDDETRKRIFEPFFTTKPKGTGTGLGLASAYGIVKNHGGIINVYSEKGKGSTFNIYLPASQKKAVKERLIGDAITTMGSATILMVDDEEMILKVGSDLLAKLGYKVLTATSGEQAINIYKGRMNEIDLVILDMIMPGMSGRDTYKRLKKLNENVKVLLSSGYSVNGEAEELLRLGCNGFIQKPFSVRELHAKTSELIKGKKTTKP